MLGICRHCSNKRTFAIKLRKSIMNRARRSIWRSKKRRDRYKAILDSLSAVN